MKTPSRAIRITKAVAVFRLSSEGCSIVSACIQVGLARSSFYEICNREPEIFGDLGDLLTETAREQLAEIMQNRVELLHKVLKDGLAEDTSPMERLAIFKQSEKQLEYLAQFIRLGDGNNEAADEVLAGPILVPGVSRYAIEATSNIEWNRTNPDRFLE
jgi:hypothetical protein